MVSADTFILKSFVTFWKLFFESVSAAGPFECLMNMYFCMRIISYRKKWLLGLGETFFVLLCKILRRVYTLFCVKKWGDGSSFFSWVKTPPWWAQTLLGWTQTCIYAAQNWKLQHTGMNEGMKLISLPPGRSVLLEQPRKSGSKVISHMLSSHGGEIFLHVLSSSRSILEDPPSISEGCGGRVTDYRITVRVFLSYTASLTSQVRGRRCGKGMVEWIAWSKFLCNKYLDRYLEENTTFVDCYASLIKYFVC